MEQLGSQMQGLLERIKLLEEERGREAAQGPHQQYAATLEALRASIVSLERALAAERRSAAARLIDSCADKAGALQDPANLSLCRVHLAPSVPVSDVRTDPDRAHSPNQTATHHSHSSARRQV